MRIKIAETLNSILKNIATEKQQKQLEREFRNLFDALGSLEDEHTDIANTMGTGGRVQTSLKTGNVTIDKSEGLRIYNPVTGNLTVALENTGDARFGSKLGLPGSTSFALFSQAQTYNTEDMTAGALLLGDNSTGKANLLWDPVTGRLLFRGSKTANAWIDTDGTLYAQDATIEGDITASSGSIGGWTIASGRLVRDTGTAATSSGMSPADYPFYAGRTYANRATAPFRVTPAGALTAASGTIGGWTITASQIKKSGIILDATADAIYVGASEPRLVLDGVGKYIQSSSFVSGHSGFRVDGNTGNAEFNNITARGILRSAVFQKDVVSAVGGTLAALDSDVLAADMTAADASTLTIEGNTSFAVGDVLRIKDGVDDEWFEVTGIDSAPTYTVTRDRAGAYAANNNPAWTKGATVVNYGASGEGGLLLTSSLANGPYLDIFTHAGAPWGGTTLKTRLGNLAGIVDPALNPSGWGLYSENVFLKGKIVATSGQVGGWAIESDRLVKDTGTGATSSGMSPGDFPFYAGQTHANRASAPFRVTPAGKLYASDAEISGKITAQSGEIAGVLSIGSSGQIQSAGSEVVFDSSGIKIDIDSGTIDYQMYRIMDGSTLIGELTAEKGYQSGYYYKTTLISGRYWDGIPNRNIILGLNAYSGSGYLAQASLTAQQGSSEAGVTCQVDVGSAPQVILRGTNTTVTGSLTVSAGVDVWGPSAFSNDVRLAGGLSVGSSTSFDPAAGVVALANRTAYQTPAANFLLLQDHKNTLTFMRSDQNKVPVVPCAPWRFAPDTLTGVYASISPVNGNSVTVMRDFGEGGYNLTAMSTQGGAYLYNDETIANYIRYGGIGGTNWRWYSSTLAQAVDNKGGFHYIIWFKPTGSGGGIRGLFQAGSATPVMLSYITATDKLVCEVYDSANKLLQVISTNSVNYNQWNYVRFRFQSNTILRMSLNGTVTEANITSAATTRTAVGDFNYGYCDAVSTSFGTGLLGWLLIMGWTEEDVLDYLIDLSRPWHGH